MWTLRRGDVCGASLAADVATETLRHPTMYHMAVILLKVMSHSTLKAFLRRKPRVTLQREAAKTKQAAKALSNLATLF